MNYISNLHTHTAYCDGKNTIEENILYAIDKNFISLGFSGHSYLQFDKAAMSRENTIKYLEDIKKFKEIYKNKIQIYSGIEADYYSNLNKNTDKEMMLDYRIGSVHFIKDDENNYFSIDASKENFVNTLKHFGNIKEVVLRYYNNLIDMINTQKPDIIGHLDLIRKYNFNKEYFTEEEDWYIEKLNEVLEVIKKSSSIVEINTKKMNKDNLNAHYPNTDTIKKLLKLNIPIIINTDAHSANSLDYFYYEMVEKLKTFGYTKIKMLIDSSFKDITLN
ncbi:histidinol-phosphatase [Brachyspira pilosicoli]|uniref:Histidinol-phosphatase n=1 Tax=Brachyspira pilosicoli TaxID=52584 RepID=A0A5C8ET88_BRAPL|nr:histidinol-phosphatase [Brachyspira pilosicoli]TXJ39430.1 histidinol-phosphatase HisJ family protein [Brachyspira pilosicoli]